MVTEKHAYWFKGIFLDLEIFKKVMYSLKVTYALCTH